MQPTFSLPHPIEGLQRTLVAADLHWEAKLKALRPPDYLPVTTYTLKLALKAGRPFLTVWMNRSRGRLEYARPWRKEAAVEMEVALLYFEDWDLAQQVTVGLGEPGTGLQGPADLHTGVVYTWATDPVFQIEQRQMLLVDLEDTENVRGRWRLKEHLLGHQPAGLAFLSTGRCAGSTKLQSLKGEE